MDDRKERDGFENYEDYDEYDGEEEEKEGVGTGVKVAFAIIITLILLLSAAVGLVLFGDSFGINVKSLFVQETTAAPTEMPTAAVTTAEPTTQAPTYSVPYVVGMAAKDAYYELNESGVKYSIKREYSETVKAEVVLGQEPESGYVTGDETVIIIISKGVDQPDTTVPPTTNGDKRKLPPQQLRQAHHRAQRGGKHERKADHLRAQRDLRPARQEIQIRRPAGVFQFEVMVQGHDRAVAVRRKLAESV